MESQTPKIQYIMVPSKEGGDPETAIVKVGMIVLILLLPALFPMVFESTFEVLWETLGPWLIVILVVCWSLMALGIVACSTACFKKSCCYCCHKKSSAFPYMQNYQMNAAAQQPNPIQYCMIPMH